MRLRRIVDAPPGRRKNVTSQKMCAVGNVCDPSESPGVMKCIAFARAAELSRVRNPLQQFAQKLAFTRRKYAHIIKPCS